MIEEIRREQRKDLLKTSIASVRYNPELIIVGAYTKFSIHNSKANPKKMEIDKYPKLRTFLKRKSDGHLKKKSKIFSPEEINAFLNNAPDKVYLATKVALIMGLMGACRVCELSDMKVEDIKDFEGGVIITIPKTKTKIVRTFTVTGQFFDIYKKYAKLRPPTVQSPFFFFKFPKGKMQKPKNWN
ncbi:hypothetical protein PPYR_03870 [Photinus pyralis]|uniref:Tyr recombinase domain-containing protein n=1 Tax=Photinus pyralis TaxID=7054 RepID=A0A5N4AWH6_PHOPY|nr:hypothetical protein PPYR_03870 [Photinus pyralis]